MKIYLFAIILSCQGCFLFNSTKSQLRTHILSSCAQIPVNWFVMEKNLFGVAKFKFGNKDGAFRKKLGFVINRYVETGEDVAQDKKVKFVSKYLPQYMKTCTAFYEPFIEKCSKLDFQGEDFKSCAEHFDSEFKNLVYVFTMDQMKRNGLVDLGAFDLNASQKMLRKMQIDPMSVFTH